MPIELPSPELLRKLLRYEPETGKLYWRTRTPDMFNDTASNPELVCRAFNSRSGGKEALTSIGGGGYKRGKVLGLSFSAHRVIFAIVHGKYPAGDTDHINGDKADNRIANLREVTHAENARNQKIPSNNKTGVIGVSFCKREQRFVANIRCGGRQKNLGYFACITAAMIARVRASRVYGYHRNHGGR